MIAGIQSPFTSVELRWFLQGGVDDNAALKRWFENSAPLPASEEAGVEWAVRRGDVPDSYLLLAGHADMGIKLREGAFQVKGLVADLGTRVFAEKHEGRVQRWIKWSYADTPLQTLFERSEHVTIEVSKRRAVRLLEFVGAGIHTEVQSSTRVEQGIAFEMTDLRVRDRAFSTIAFEAFPDSASTRAEFDGVVASFLAELDEPRLGVANSMSYPAWLSSLLT